MSFICGIPQGSCLGPLLIRIYLNGFENSPQGSRASIYTDEINVTVAFNDIKRLTDDARHEIINLSEWMRVS